MTETPDVPVLGLNGAVVQTWAHLLLLSADQLRGLLSAATQTEREVADLRRDARPCPVRPMTEAEMQQWPQHADLVEEHRRSNAAASRVLSVRIGPLDDGRWGLVAQVHSLGPRGDPVGDPIVGAAVSCVSERHAREIGDELLVAGFDESLVTRLAEYAAERATRQAAAAAQLREPKHVRLDRTRATIRARWNPVLAERVIGSPQFGAFAWRLHQLEERGRSMNSILGLLDQGELLGPRVRDPAHLAEWMCENLLLAIDEQQPLSSYAAPSRAASRGDRAGDRGPFSPRPGDPSPGAARGDRAPSGPRPGDPSPGVGETPRAATVQPPPRTDRVLRVNTGGEVEVIERASPQEASLVPALAETDRVLRVNTGGEVEVIEQGRRAAVTEATSGPALRTALGDGVYRALRTPPASYRRLLGELADLHGCGWRLDALLVGLPTDRILHARDPSRYLLAVVTRRTRDSAPRPTGPNRHAMAAVVREAFGSRLGSRVVDGSTWPMLAAALAHARDSARPGDPSVAELLGDMPVRLIARAHYPAAYTATVLGNMLPAHRRLTAESTAGQHRGLDPSSPTDRVLLGDPPSPRLKPRPSTPPRDSAVERAADAEQRGADTAAALRAQVTLTPVGRAVDQPPPPQPQPPARRAPTSSRQRRRTR